MKLATALLITTVCTCAFFGYVWCAAPPAIAAAVDAFSMWYIGCLVDTAHAVHAAVFEACNSRFTVALRSALEMVVSFLYTRGEWVGAGLWHAVKVLTQDREDWDPNTLLKMKREDVSSMFLFDVCQKLMFVFTWRKLTGTTSAKQFLYVVVDKFLDKICCFYMLFIVKIAVCWLASQVATSVLTYVRTMRGYRAEPAVKRPVKYNVSFFACLLYAFVSNWVVQIIGHLLFWFIWVIYELHIMENWDLATRLATDADTAVMWLNMVREYEDSACLERLFPGKSMSHQ